MKKFVLTAILAIVSYAVNAQQETKKFRLALGPTLSMPLSDFKETSKLGFGAELEGSLSLSESFQGFAQVGYASFSGKSFDLGFGTTYQVPTISLIPVLIGGRYVTNGISFGAGLGYSSFKASGTSSEGGVTYSPQIGYDFGKIQGIINYTSTSVDGSNISFLGLKVFYKF
jgi:hypothetical protein